MYSQMILFAVKKMSLLTVKSVFIFPEKCKKCAETSRRWYRRCFFLFVIVSWKQSHVFIHAVRFDVSRRVWKQDHVTRLWACSVWRAEKLQRNEFVRPRLNAKVFAANRRSEDVFKLIVCSDVSAIETWCRSSVSHSFSSKNVHVLHQKSDRCRQKTTFTSQKTDSSEWTTVLPTSLIIIIIVVIMIISNNNNNMKCPRMNPNNWC